MASASQGNEREKIGFERGMENFLDSEVLNALLTEAPASPLPRCLRSDPRLYQDGADIKFSRAPNSGKVPQIRHASVERLLSRLIDLRLQNAEFLHTFLLTYRVYTDSQSVLAALQRLYRQPDCCLKEPIAARLGEFVDGSSDTRHDPLSSSPSVSPSPPSSRSPLPPRQGSAPAGAGAVLSESYPPHPRGVGGGGQPMGRLLRRLSTGGEGGAEGEKGYRMKASEGSIAGPQGQIGTLQGQTGGFQGQTGGYQGQTGGLQGQTGANQGQTSVLWVEDRRHSVNECLSSTRHAYDRHNY